MSERNELEVQLRALMSTAVGEPRRRITVEAVRRRLLARRVVSSAAVATAVVLAGGVGIAVAAHGKPPQHQPAHHSQPVSTGVPRYYVVRTTTARGEQTTVRVTASGAVTARVRCPWDAANVVPGVVAAADQGTFFLVCQRLDGTVQPTTVLESRIYEFRVTSAGRIGGIVMVRGGTLDGVRVRRMTVTPDGSEIAVIVVPGRYQSFLIKIPADVFVINTRSGGRAIWHAASPVPGKTVYYPQDVSLTADGRDLAFLTSPQCFPARNGPNCTVHGGAQVRVASPAAAGGQLNEARVLVRLTSVLNLSAASVLDAVVGPDGSTVTLAIGGNLSGRRLPDAVSIVQVSATGQEPPRTVYRMMTGNGYGFTFFSADPSVRHLLLGAGGASGPVAGRIGGRHLVPLKPGDYTVDFMAW